MDPIANMLTQIRNTQAARHESCTIPFSRVKEEILRILKEQRYIRDYRMEETGGKKHIIIQLAYGANDEPVIHRVLRRSKPGRRVYRTTDTLPYVLNGIGCAIVSTSKGLMTDKKARKEGVGGEVLCEVW